MISDTLFEAIQEIDHYLLEEEFSHVYTGALRERILKCREEMLAIQTILDTPPNVGRAEGDAGADNPQGAAFP